MSDKKYGVFFWRKGERVEDVPSDKNVANRGVKPKRIFTDYIDGMRYKDKMNATIPAAQKEKYEYVLNEIVDADLNNTKELFKSGNLTEALKARRAINQRNEIADLVKRGVHDYLNITLGNKK
ncbi:hypothetical protein CTX76_000755 [Salmonella enterica subsp. houtenae]|uniref:Uncharacterized protein n=2 Tax=Salmonella enterica TaxID=28901 RepID=A0A5Y4ZFH8_SALER|nr:hypothetical protein [Salmonella enterica]EBP3986217.1 hypothetical protein [Salmonella enterica subsp. enterica]ECE5931193.1 hypothetical protein [Salmonella enterica subsp. houtenae]EDG3665362.1 hypothetical protein [Salmonella enterica subsp. enterica serovar Give]EAO1138601.1 hypothetical protein [Salmonella enterica]EAO4981759.1 hypothetical protein [Salmonella enterica]